MIESVEMNNNLIKFRQNLQKL